MTKRHKLLILFTILIYFGGFLVMYAMTDKNNDSFTAFIWCSGFIIFLIGFVGLITKMFDKK